ncbi:uncharacterized protein LOC117202095 isoform X2 [Orcinus orca]|uniref:uncharacterized protein LOC117202095 isoform X2 n=1 Tax=Orcinus orca TaxID=9733 RepID=UPI002111C305|nr:uncharacterized protein LOC117202095 isoform X2 [Orcinus orca]
MTMSAPSPGQRLQKQREMPPRGLQSRPSPSDPPPTTPAQLGGSGGGARAPGRPHARAPRPRATRRGTGSGDGAGQRPSGGVGCEEAVVAEKRPEASALNNKRISEAWEVQDQGVSRFGVWFIPRDVQQREVYPTFCKNQLPSSLRSLGCDSQSPGLGIPCSRKSHLPWMQGPLKTDLCEKILRSPANSQHQLAIHFHRGRGTVLKGLYLRNYTQGASDVPGPDLEDEMLDFKLTL